MNIQTIAFISGLALVAVGIFGGGVEAKEVKVPKLSPLSRIFTVVFGALLLAGAGGAFDRYIAQDPASATAAVAPAAAASPQATVPAGSAPTPAPNSYAANSGAPLPVPAAPQALIGAPPTEPVNAEPAHAGTSQISIDDEMAEGGETIYEKITVYVNENEVGSLSLTEEDNTDRFTVRVRVGDPYRLVGTQGVMEEGRLVTYTLIGSGVFEAPLVQRYSAWLSGTNGTTKRIFLKPQ